MAALVLTTLQSQILTALEQPMIDALGDGVIAPGGNPPVIPGYKAIKELDSDGRTKALNGIKVSFAPLIQALIKDETPVYSTVASFLNGYSNWGDGNYSAGSMRYYKDLHGYVHVNGLMKTPDSGLVQYVTAFNLPAGFRPVAGDGHIFAQVSADAFMSVEVLSNGNVTPRSVSIAATWISLDFSFYAGG